MHLVLLVGLTLLSACERTPREMTAQVVRADSAGVEVVTAPGRDVALDVRTQPLFRLGGEEEGPGSFYSLHSTLVAADGEGRIYVLHRQESRVEVYSPEGKLVRIMGGPGEGPGETAVAGALAVAPDGEASVFSFGKGTLVRFDPEGEPLGEVPLEAPPAFDSPRGVRAVSGALVLARARGGAEEGMDEHSIVVLPLPEGEAASGPEGEEMLFSFGRFGGRLGRFERCSGGVRLPPLLTPVLTWDARGEHIAWAAPAEYRVDVFRAGQVVRSVRRDLEVPAVTPELARADAGEGMTIHFGPGNPCTITPREMVEAWGHHDELQLVKGVTVGPDGTLWINRRQVRGGALEDRVDVFDPSGEYLGTLPSETPFPVLLLPDDRIAYIETDALDVDRLVVARVVPE